ncbi:hypothetical protein [Fodinicola feengrottensis]|uniref:Uncharacterized protein n=1 Tax=Fodinicola feengrottensis TaxID=435914 RepID=A0ABN2I7M2_9ACTN|nr:hypothetical protein [Fodinicola feengrottensis]
MNAPRTQCPVCAGTGRPGVVGVEKVTFGPRKLLGAPAPTMTPLVDSVGGIPYVGTGLRLRRATPATGAFCSDHAPEARRLAADGLTLAAAVRRLTRAD